MTFWHTLDDVRNFAGSDYRRAVVEPDARAVLASFDEHADHFEIACDSEAGCP